MTTVEIIRLHCYY